MLPTYVHDEVLLVLFPTLPFAMVSFVASMHICIYSRPALRQRVNGHGANINEHDSFLPVEGTIIYPAIHTEIFALQNYKTTYTGPWFLFQIHPVTQHSYLADYHRFMYMVIDICLPFLLAHLPRAPFQVETCSTEGVASASSKKLICTWRSALAM